MSSAAGLWELFQDQAERGSGIGLKLFGFIAETAFTIIPDFCSGSSWNGVRNHPGIAFTLDRIPQSVTATTAMGRSIDPLAGRGRFEVGRYDIEKII